MHVSTSTSHHFQLPAAPDIIPDLNKAGISPALIERLSRIYRTKASAMHQETLDNIRQVFADVEFVGTSMHDKVIQTFSKIFLAKLESWKSHLLRRIPAHNVGDKKARPAFRNEYVPLLEKYFKQNAYPSARDRCVLADQTGMTVRQIEVWFQNHRNRARKSGQPLRRLAHDQSPPPDAFLEELGAKDTLESKKTVSLSHSKMTQNRNEAAESQTYPNLHDDPQPPAPLRPSPDDTREKCDLFNTDPPHAFPAIFPPTCDYDPFPVLKTGRCDLPAPQWPHSPPKCASIKKKRELVTSVDELAIDFALQMNLAKGIERSRKRIQEPLPESKYQQRWFPATHVLLCKGRHPAFVPESNPSTRCSSQKSNYQMPQQSRKRVKLTHEPSPPKSLRARSLSSSCTATSSSYSTPTTPDTSPLLVPKLLDHSSSYTPSSLLGSHRIVTSCGFQPYAGLQISMNTVCY